MAYAKLKIPTLFRQIKDEFNEVRFEVRPLFFGNPLVTHKRYDRARQLFKNEIRKFFAGYKLTRSSSQSLLWFSFHPELNYNQYKFQFTTSGHYVDGLFSAIHFEMQGHTFITLPAFDDYMFMAVKDGLSLENQILKVIQNHFRSYAKDKENEFDWKDYVAPKKEFVRLSNVEVGVGNSYSKFKPSNDDNLFAFFNSNLDFDGEEELTKTGYALNHKYPAELNYAFYQEELTTQLGTAIYGKECTPLVLIGQSGVGKHAVVHQSVRNYLEENIFQEEIFADHLWHIDPARVISGMSIVGQWERRFETILEYLQEPLPEKSRKDKLLIDNAVALLRIGQAAQSNMNLASVLKPYLEQRTLQLLVLATPEEWKLVQEKDRSFSDLFQVIRVQEPDEETCAKIVLKQRRFLERRENSRVTIQAIRQLFIIQRNYLKNQAMPGALLKLMEQLVTKYTLRTIDAPEVREEFENYSGYRQEIFDYETDLENDDLIDYFSQRLVGQPKAVKILTNLVHIIKAKLTNGRKPLGSYLFIGPTGVGKTQAVKVLANYLMGSQDRLLRFDMNEYIDGLAVSRLIGDYANPEGQLTGKVRYQPFSILLLDEIEKANSAVHDLLLQVLDDGRLTDSIGRTVDFSNTIIIMTSNLGAREVSSRLGFGVNKEDEAAIYRKSVEQTFRPEMINRIGEIVIFNPLELEHILGIARLQIGELLERDGFVRRTTILNIEPKALEWVARRGFDSRMGGRALKRQIERDLTELSAEQLVTTYSEQPIIFDILLENDKLIPRITPLEFAKNLGRDILPELPNVERGRRFYNTLIRDLEKIEGKIKRIEPPQRGDVIRIGAEGGSRLNWQYYDFKDRVSELKENIKTVALGFRDSRFSLQPAIPLRLKTSRTYDDSWTAERNKIKDRLFQQEALQEISEEYAIGSPEFDSLNTEFIDNFLNVEILKKTTNGFMKERTDKIIIRFQSLISGKGSREKQFLVSIYAAFLEEMNIAFEIAKDKKSISAEGFSLFDILKGEVGIHLFYEAHRNPTPIRLSIQKEKRKSKENLSVKVLRIYARGTMTDLRTGYVNATSVTAREMKLLVYSGILAVESD